MERPIAGSSSRWLLVGWGVLTGLTLLELSTPLRFSSVATRSAVHCLAWLLALAVAVGSRSRVARGLAWAQLGVAVVVPIVFAGVYALTVWSDFFFQAVDTSYDESYTDRTNEVDFALLRRGPERIYFRHVGSRDPAHDRAASYNQLVVVRSLLPGLRWQWPLADEARLDAGWQVLDSATLAAFVPPARLNQLLPGGWVDALALPPKPAPLADTAAAALPAPPATPVSAAPVTAREARIYTYVERMPALPGGGGQSGIEQAIRQRVAWPARQVQPVVVSFVVEPTGSLTDVRASRGVSARVDSAVAAAVCQLPAFTPGRQNGELVAVRYLLAVRPVAPRP